MGAYNRTLGEPCCASRLLLRDILRGRWDFPGHVVSDCGAIDDIHRHHHVTKNAAESAALAVRNGCDLNCGCTYNDLVVAVRDGLISEAAAWYLVWMLRSAASWPRRSSSASSIRRKSCRGPKLRRPS